MKHFVTYLAEQYERQSRLDDFVEFAANYLNLPQPHVTLLYEREPHMTTASYNIKTKEIKVCVRGRAIFDVCRSVAHEMVHQEQHNRITNVDGSTGSPHEDEANAVAGRIVREYGKLHPEFYDES